MKVRFSDAFLASCRINQRQRMQKYTCCCFWHVSDVTFKFSPLHLVSGFWLLAVRAFVLCNSFLSLASEPISVSILPTCDQSASQECRFATPKEKKRAGFKTRPPAFRLGRTIMSIRLSVPVRKFSLFPPVTTPLAQVGKGRIDQPIPVTTVDYFMKNEIAYFCAKVFMDIHSVRHFI